MKHILCATALLLTLTICCCAAVWRIASLTGEVSALLQEAEDALSSSRYDFAEAKIAEAHALWIENRGFWGTVLRHSETDQLTESLELLLNHVQRHDQTELWAQLVTARTKLRHLAEMEQAFYYNFL